ncbi:MAG: hypothetical protein NTY53_17270, partial [Kiritimatiellaeota bacterium]|nr:hypothetical protein [Kiritimatiellota bacterium]
KDDDGTVRADGYSAGQLNNNNDQLQGQASGLGGEIAALQGQIFASHNTPEKQDLMNQLQAKLDQMQGLQGDVNANNAFLNAMNQGGGASVYSGLPASTLAGMEPTAGDAKNIKIPKVPVLAGVMGALDADHASQATTALANLDLQGKNVKANWVSYDAYNQIKNTLDAAGYQGHLTRAQAAQLLAQAQQANSWGSTIGNALVDSVQQGGTAFGQAVGGAAANAANTAIKNAVDGKSKPDSGSGSGDGSGNSNADSSGGDKKPSDSGGKNNDCNDGCPPSSSSTGGGQTGGGIGSTSGNSGGNSTGDGAPSPPPSSGGGGGSYAVFLLNNVSGGSIWVGSESDLKNSHTYDFHGGGLKNGDGSSQLLKYEKKSGDFATREEAMAAYKGALTSPPKTMPLTGGGQKAQIYGGNYWVDSVR